MIGNGNTLIVSHTNSNHFSSNLSMEPLLLNNIFHVPFISKNLLNVSQFARDNSVFLEFNPSYCCVKDQVEGKTLLQG